MTEWTICRGDRDPNRIVVAWMGRPLESKGLLTLPYLLAMDKRIVVRAWTGAETAGLAYTQKVQAQTMEKLLALAKKLGVIDRLDRDTRMEEIVLLEQSPVFDAVAGRHMIFRLQKRRDPRGRSQTDPDSVGACRIIVPSPSAPRRRKPSPAPATDAEPLHRSLDVIRSRHKALGGAAQRFLNLLQSATDSEGVSKI